MTRLLSALVLIIIFALPVAFGPVWMFFLLTLIILPSCLYELFTVSLEASARPLGWIVTLGSIPLLWFIYTGSLVHVCCTLIIISLAVMVTGLFLFETNRSTARDTSAALSGIIYPMLLLGCWILLRMGTDGRFWLIFGLVCTFFSDGGAYYAGKNLGRHCLARRLSPNKTWEGLLGGGITSMVAGTLSYYIYTNYVPLEIPVSVWTIVALAPVITLLGLTGDLSASMIKREFKVKDMGNLIPGHGGMLDRMDGVIPVGAALYIILRIIQ
ncbi:MAG: CDP-archaeol synthase [Thermodesulfobacteriota bacterium]|nr:CDP-archaeol synthase [Thermodesulfobacteriota bacterium]